MTTRLKFPIHIKTIVLIIVFALIVIISATATFNRLYTKRTHARFEQTAESLSKTVAETVDAESFARLKERVDDRFQAADPKVPNSEWGSDEWTAYIALFQDIEQDPDFVTLRDELRRIQDVNPVQCVYLVYVDPSTFTAVYVVDAAHEDACPPGSFDVLMEIHRPLAENPGLAFPAYRTDLEEYGSLLTAGYPVYLNGSVVGHAMVDISESSIEEDTRDVAIRGFIYLTGIGLCCCIAGLLIIHFMLVKPVRKLKEATEAYGQTGAGEKSSCFSELNIHTRDEIEDLAMAMRQMELDQNEKIDQLNSAESNLILTEEEKNRMSKLAKQDALTGVKNKSAYNDWFVQLEEEMKGNCPPFGIIVADLNGLKTINDTYGHESGDRAIIKICSLICDVFVHSPVFRIGGDEFAVILQGQDYEQADELTARLLQMIEQVSADETLSPEERVSAAIGFARFVPNEDENVSDVFRRADRAMYQRKREMKGLL